MLDHALGVEDRQRRGRQHEVHPVGQRQPVLRLRPHPGQPGPPHRLGALQPFAPVGGETAVDGPARASRPARLLRLTQQHGGDVGLRGQVAAGSQRALGRDLRRHPAVQHPGQRLGHQRPHAGEALRQRVRPDQHHRSHDLGGQRIADAGRAVQHQVVGEATRLAGPDAPAGQRPEPGVHAVDRPLVALDHTGQPITAAGHRSDDLVGERAQLLARASHAHDLLDRQAVAIDLDHFGSGQESSNWPCRHPGCHNVRTGHGCATPCIFRSESINGDPDPIDARGGVR